MSQRAGAPVLVLCVLTMRRRRVRVNALHHTRDQGSIICIATVKIANSIQSLQQTGCFEYFKCYNIIIAASQRIVCIVTTWRVSR